MKKSRLCSFLVCSLGLLLSFSGCNSSAVSSDFFEVPVLYVNDEEGNRTDYFSSFRVSSSGAVFDDAYVLVDNNTHVMYLYVRGVNKAGLTVMLDADGKPLLYNDNDLEEDSP